MPKFIGVAALKKIYFPNNLLVADKSLSRNWRRVC
jgi:hypothetical protein